MNPPGPPPQHFASRLAPGRFGLVAVTAMVVFAQSALTRIGLFAMSEVGNAGALAVIRAFAAGAAFDALVALWMAAPVAAYLVVASERRYGRRSRRVLRRAALALVIATAVFDVAAEFVFFDEFDGRFNFVAVDYLIFPTEVVTNIWQSYPLVWIVVGIGTITAAVMWALRNVLATFDANDGPARGGRWKFGAAYLALLALLSFTISARWSRVSDNRVLNEIAANGYYTFFQAALARSPLPLVARGVDAPYEGWYATRPESAVTARLARLMRERATVPHAALPGTPGGTPAHPVNVVLVLDESFGSEFVSALRPRDSLPITPSFDSLVAEGTVLTRAYSTGNRTIRAIEATSVSIPPLPGLSIVQRVPSTNLFTLAAMLRASGYSTEFIYGGRAPFDGMGSFARANGFEQVFDQGKFPPGSFTTAWGVADEVIFDGALAQMDSLHATGKPFYTMILTVSNHKPYTYPTGRIPQNPLEHRRTFAVRYSDWALGRFMRAARSRAFFDHTLFVLMGDHGARVYGAAEIPLPSYEVPVLFYAPKYVRAGGRINTVASALDVPTTILALLGMNADTPFFGFDVFAADSAHGRAFMIHNNNLALMRGGRMVVLGLHQSATLYSVDAGGTLHRIAAPDSAGRELIEDAIAYYYGADQLYRRGGLRFDAARARKK